ncbi:MAG TPA: ABC transporter permease [Bryobacteraceae bacterium]|nr:ABC transporter permease [Bryobacteraceae bacterium]
MRVAKRARRIFGNLLRRDQAEDTLDAELRAYVDELTERNIARGMSREEARRQALMAAGGIKQLKEQVRDAWLGQGIETALQDVRYGCRSLLRSPGFTVVVVATLALAIGANLTMLSLMRAVLWRPLPYSDPNRIAMIRVDARNVPDVGATRAELRGIGERSRTLQQASTVYTFDADLEYAGEAEHIAAANVSDDFFPLLGVRPARGRTLDSRIDFGKNGAFAILISDELWRRRFSADPGIVGRIVRINDVEMRIVGVLPPGFRLFLPPSVSGLEQIDVWFPFFVDATVPYRGIPIIARLRPGATLDAANAELQTLAAQFEREHPEFYSGAKGWQASPADRGPGAKVRFTARLLHDDMTGEARPALFLLSGAVGFVLLIACVNVANLMLARGSARQREMEIRRALGAGTIRIVRQLFTESLMLAVASSAIGLLCARFGLEAIARQGASHIPLQSRIGMDAPAAFYALALAVFTSILFGLLPAGRLASGRTGQALRAGRTETAGAGARTLQRTLVAAEVALSIVPLACGGLMLRSFLNLLRSPLGFEPANVVSAAVPINVERFPHTSERWAFLRDVLDRVRALPGVQAASAADPLPLGGHQTRRVGRTDQPDALPILATQQFALPGYLGAIGTPLREGRDFSDDDVAAQRGVTIIDERLAKRLWPEGAIGKRLSVYRTGLRNDLEVVGVTSAVRTTAVRDEDVPHFMLPYGEYPGTMSLVVRTRETAQRIAPRIQAAVNAARGGRAAFDIRPMSDYVADSIGDTRFILLVLAAFAGASVLLAAVGLYGTLAYLTAQRTREFGIRLALGSSMGAIVAIVLRESVLLATTGVAVGLVGVAAATGAIRNLLYGVRPLDGATLAGVVGLVAIVALGAAVVPAWRATRIDPQTSLRSE